MASEKPSRDHQYILNKLIPELTKKIVADRVHYGDNHETLGLKGQFADIWRKITPLKRSLWEGRELTREQPREICMDLIGHCLLTIAMLDREEGEKIGVEVQDTTTMWQCVGTLQDPHPPIRMNIGTICPECGKVAGT